MLYFLKLGGSLITQKNRAHTVRRQVLTRLAAEIAAALKQKADLKLVFGHGSGSFGHFAGKRYNTRNGVQTPEQWNGFVEVWQEARALNQIVIETLRSFGLPVIAFPPSASVLARDGKVIEWNLMPLQNALSAGLIPIIFGDVVFDTARGGTILSTEELFVYLAKQFLPERILLAGIEEGVWEDFPACTRLVRNITPQSYAHIAGQIGGSRAIDVTGGMAEKVQQMLELIKEYPSIQALIFSGAKNDLVRLALLGENPGTLIHADRVLSPL